MKTIPIGVSELSGSRLAYGCWRIAGEPGPSGASPQQVASGSAAVIAAYEAGYTLFDHADIYGGGEAERIFGKVLSEVSGMRERIIIATKCGVRHGGEPEPNSPNRYDLSAAHIERAVEGSLQRLGVDVIDLLMLHRPDYLTDPHEVAGAFSKLKDAGKVRWFGVSNFRPTLVTALQVACPMPLIVNEIELSLTRLDPFTDGTLDQCLIEGITPLAWSPLGGGLLGHGPGRLLRWQEAYRPEPIVAVLDEIAGDHKVSRSAVALAWLMKHPAKIVPIVGSTKPDRIREAAKADDLELSHDEWYRLLNAARSEPLE